MRPVIEDAIGAASGLIAACLAAWLCWHEYRQIPEPDVLGCIYLLILIVCCLLGSGHFVLLLHKDVRKLKKA